MTHRCLRRSAPRFELNLPPRTLQTMSAVSSDSLGTTYAVQQGGGAPNQQQLVCPRPSGHGATRVLPHLYLGTYGDAQSSTQLRALGIRRILNVAEECDSGSDGDDELGIHVKQIHLRDHSDERISDHFADALAYIHDAIQQQETVLVHCRMGVSRSATIVMAYLMRYGTNEASPQSMSYEASFDYVKERRPQVSPNIGFVLALHQLEEETKVSASSLQSAW